MLNHVSVKLDWSESGDEGTALFAPLSAVIVIGNTSAAGKEPNAPGAFPMVALQVPPTPVLSEPNFAIPKSANGKTPPL
jgi:hypothetical protein